jgi:hypothetical protein
MLHGMFDFRTNLHQPLPLDRIENYPVARQPRLEYLNLELEEPEVRVAPRRPRLLQQHQQRHQPLWKHRLALFHTERKSSNSNSPTFWTTAGSNAMCHAADGMRKKH